MEKPYSLSSLRRLFDFPDEDMHSLTKNHARMSMNLMDDLAAEIPTVITTTKTNKFGVKQTRKMLFDWSGCVWRVVDPKGKTKKEFQFSEIKDVKRNEFDSKKLTVLFGPPENLSKEDQISWRIQRDYKLQCDTVEEVDSIMKTIAKAKLRARALMSE